MKKSVVRCAPPEPLSSVSGILIKWDLCCFCQSSDTVSLICPSNNPIKNLRNQGYTTIASNLTELTDLEYTLPCGRNVNILDEGDGIEACLIKYKARWHQSCAIKFRNPRFKTLLKNLRTRKIPECPENGNAARPKTRSLASPSVSMKELKCFICLGPETRKYPLCLCTTKEITEKVKLCASALGELRIIGMIETGGDLIAMEAKYHKPCLSQLYNRNRCLSIADDPNQKSTDFCENIAFAELVLYIESKLTSDVQYIFDMGDITKAHHSRIADLKRVSETEVTIMHTTRLREKLLSYFPTLVAEKWGKRYVLKSRSTNFMPNIYKEDQDDDALAFHRFSKAIRNSLSATKVAFQGDFTQNCEEECIPGPLLAAVSTLLYGAIPTDYSGARRPVITICQLIMLNFREAMPKGGIVRHRKKLEPPFPLYMGLSIYGRSRDKQYIDLMHEKGVSVSYNRITEVTSQLCRLVVQRARDENVVCPANLKKNIFTMAALDNIDFKSTSNTSAFEFHGTGISVFQCPTKENIGQPREFVTSFNHVRCAGDRSVPNLPPFYSNVPDCVLKNERPPPSAIHVVEEIQQVVSSGKFAIFIC